MKRTGPAATVLIPTHDHTALLPHAARSALAQTIEDLELFIVGDGAPDATREVVAGLAQEDERVRYFDRPKGERNGEAYRHPILAEACGPVVCYLSDDDLWLPDHVETMLAALVDADFAAATTLSYRDEDELEVHAHDLSDPYYRELQFSGVNRIPLSAGAHTRAMYRRLPHGWRTTPAGTPTDLYMWQQFLSTDSCRAMSVMKPTVLNFPSSKRVGWSPARREAELVAWSERIADPKWRRGFAADLPEMLVRAHAAEWARLHADLTRQHEMAARRGRKIAELKARVEGLELEHGATVPPRGE